MFKANNKDTRTTSMTYLFAEWVVNVDTDNQYHAS